MDNGEEIITVLYNSVIPNLQNYRVMEKMIPRKLLKDIEKFKNRREIIGIRGPRQAGKTTLIKIIESKVKNSIFVNLDIPENRRVIEETPLDFIKYSNRAPLFLCFNLKFLQTLFL